VAHSEEPLFQQLKGYAALKYYILNAGDGLGILGHLAISHPDISKASGACVCTLLP